MFAIMAFLQSKNVSSSDSIEKTISTDFLSENSISFSLFSSEHINFEHLEVNRKSNSNNGVFATSLLDGGYSRILSIITTQ
jgi:urate oxidase